MKKLFLTCVLGLTMSACGGASPELYRLLIERVDTPTNCYSENNEPNTTNERPPGQLQVQVWDGPDGLIYLTVDDGSFPMSMGEAPAMSIGGVFDGAADGDAVKYTQTNKTVTTTEFGDNEQVLTTTATATITFPRTSGAFTGTAELNSSRACTGPDVVCPESLTRSCKISNLTVTGTRLAVQYERAP